MKTKEALDKLLKIQHRITGFITELLPGQIFVFGSNTLGIHSAGAAKQAKLKYKAKMYVGEGLTGQCYALPTKGMDFSKSLSTSQIQNHVNTFIACAKENPHLTFLVTEIGCGLANYKPRDIAPLFKEAMELENVHLPRAFWNVLLGE